MEATPVGEAPPAHVLGEQLQRRHAEPRGDVPVPVEDGDDVAEDGAQGDRRVQDARVVDVLAAGARHRAAEDAPDERGADAGGDGADGDRDEQVAGRVERERDAHHEPQGGDGLTGHEAGSERVPHVETAHEAAGFACEDEIFGHTSPWNDVVGGGHEPASRQPLPRAVALLTSSHHLPTRVPAEAAPVVADLDGPACYGRRGRLSRTVPLRTTGSGRPAPRAPPGAAPSGRGRRPSLRRRRPPLHACGMHPHAAAGTTTQRRRQYRSCART